MHPWAARLLAGFTLRVIDGAELCRLARLAVNIHGGHSPAYRYGIEFTARPVDFSAEVALSARR